MSCHPPLTSAQHASKVVVTENGKTYTGVVPEGSSNGLGTLQGDSYRPAIAQSDVEDLFPSSVSTMPRDLSDNLTPQEMSTFPDFWITYPLRAFQ